MLSALAGAGRILGKHRYLEEAEAVASFIFENLMVDGHLLHRWRDGKARFDAVLEDYAFFIQGLLDLYDAPHNCAHLRQAIDLSNQQIDFFADSDGGFLSSQDKPDLLTRMKETHDEAEPSRNSVAALNFLHLVRMLSQAKWTTAADPADHCQGHLLPWYPGTAGSSPEALSAATAGTPGQRWRKPAVSPAIHRQHRRYDTNRG